MIDKLQFDYRRNDTERVRAVTTIAAPGTHCLSGHPDKLQFELQKIAKDLTHPSTLNYTLGTLVVGLGCFPFDNGTYLSLSDSLLSIRWYSQFDRFRYPAKGPRPFSALPPTIFTQRLALKLFRGEPAISRLDWNFSAIHKSSPTISTGVCSALHKVLPLLQPAHG